MLVCVFLCMFAHETAGAACTRSSLRPLLLARAEVQANLGHIVPRECGVTSSLVKNMNPKFPRVIASVAKQSMLQHAWRDGLLRFARNDGGWNCALLYHADLAEISQYVGMDQLDIGCGRDRVGRRRLAGLRQFLAEPGFDPVQRLRQPVGN